MPPLKNLKRERFCLAYFGGLTGERAAIEAGYSPRAARQIASRLLTFANVSARLKEFQELASNDKVMSVIDRKIRLTEIIRGRITDFVSEKGIETKDKPYVAAISHIKTRVKYFKKGAEPEIITDLQLHDPIRAIEELNKMEKIYDQAPVINQDNRILNIIVKDDETKELIARVGDRTKKPAIEQPVVNQEKK